MAAKTIGRPFTPGVSPNPGGRPKSAKTLRARLVKEFGEDAGGLVDRLKEMAFSRDRRLAFQATELLLAYHAGKPTQHMDIDANALIEPLRVVITEGPPA